MTKIPINPKTIYNGPSRPFSLGVIAEPPGRLLFVSGQAATDENGKVVGKGDVKTQTRRVLEKIKNIIEAAGGTVKDIVSVTVFLTNMQDYQAMNEVRREFFGGEFPSSTAIGVTALVNPDFLVEINAVAMIPG